MNICKEHAEDFAKGGQGQPVTLCIHHTHSCKYIYIYIHNMIYEQGSKDAMKGFNYDRSSLLKICDLLCVAIGGLM